MGGNTIDAHLSDSTPEPEVSASIVVCQSLVNAYGEVGCLVEQPEAVPPWIADPLRYRSPHARVVPTALIRRRDG